MIWGKDHKTLWHKVANLKPVPPHKDMLSPAEHNVETTLCTVYKLTTIKVNLNKTLIDIVIVA